MDLHYPKAFERHSEEDKSCLPSDSLFEDICGPQTDRDQALSADSLWNLSDDSMMLFTGMDSSNHTSEASEFTSFSELGYSENPSSIFNQSLDIFASGGNSTAGQMDQSQGENEEILEGEDKSDPSNLLPFESISEFYNNSLVGSEADVSLGWSFDLFENSKIMQPNDVDPTLSANPDHLNSTIKIENEGLSRPASNQNRTPSRQKFDDLHQNFSTLNHNTNTAGTQPFDNSEGWRVLSAAEDARTNNAPIPWEWHSFEYKKADNSRLNTANHEGKNILGISESQKSSSDSLEKENSTDPIIDDFTGKKERRKPKPIAKRFQPIGTVTVIPSYVQCLNIVLDYHGYTGTITRIVLNNAITNVAYQQHDSAYRSSLMKKPLVEFYSVPEHEELVGSIPAGNGAETPISLISGVLQRKIHIRDIASILTSVQLIAYVKSGRFSIHNPYEPQYYRYELDAKGKAVNESKCGMCAFCPTVKFLPFKNSSYLSHMTLEHGIFASNFVVPEGLYYGRYRMVRSTDPSKTRTVKALQCPACFQVIEVACWKNKTNPLLSYFRHFKKLHLNLNKTFTSSSIDPVTLKHRGGNISQNETLGLIDHQ